MADPTPPPVVRTSNAPLLMVLSAVVTVGAMHLGPLITAYQARTDQVAGARKDFATATASLKSIGLALASYKTTLDRHEGVFTSLEESAAATATTLDHHGNRFAISDKAAKGTMGDVAALQVAVKSLQDRTVPTPVPTPAPAPVPPPAPPVVGYSGPLWGFYVVPDPPDVTQSTIRSSPTIRDAFKADPLAYWETRAVTGGDIQTPGWQKLISDNGPPPVLLWLRSDASLIMAVKSPTEAIVLSGLKAVRGK